MALDDGAIVDPGRQRAQRTASVAGDPARAEGVCDRRIAVADEDRSLQGDGHAFHQPACARFEVARVGELGLEPCDVAVQPPSSPDASSSSAMKASNVAGVCAIARATSSALTLPDPSQIELSGISR